MTQVARKLIVSLVAVAALYAVGTTGFVLVGGRTVFESLYVTTVILTTVGMKESGLPLSGAEQAWSLLLMIAGIGTVLYAMGNVVAFFIDGQIRTLVGRRQLMHKVNAMSDHFVVVGFGRMGQALCTTLQYKQVPFVLIENSEDRLEQADELGIVYVTGDAMQESTLLAAGIDRARGMATCLPHDADNVFVTLTARGLHEKVKIIARAEDLRTEAKLRRAGADRVICPPLIGATRIKDMLLNPAVEEVLELDGYWPDLELSKLAIQRFPRAVGKTLDELSLTGQQDLMVIAVVGADGQQRFNPEAPTRLHAGDELVVVATAGRLAHIIRCLELADAA